MEGGQLGRDAGHHQPFIASGRSGAMDLGMRLALTVGLLAMLVFCVIGFWVTFQSPEDRYCPCVYSILIVLYGIGVARLLQPVFLRA
jgi:hypothetical protein